MKSNILILSMLCFLMSGCEKLTASTPATINPHPESDQIAEALKHQEQISQMAAMTVREKKSYDVISYSLVGRFDEKTLVLSATNTLQIKLLNNSSNILIDNSTEVFSVTSSDGSLLPYQIQGPKLWIDISSLKALDGDLISLDISYKASANRGDAHRMNRGLMYAGPKRGDPNQETVVYTHSEPLDASLWMPCNLDPSDRAIFSVEMTMPPHQQLIGNGRLVFDLLKNGHRHSKFTTDFTLSAYLMAFAFGDFQKLEKTVGNLPIRVYARKGLAKNLNYVLDQTVQQMSFFQTILGSYPWGSYSVVLIPDNAMGGMEHVTTTYISENSMLRDNNSARLLAHELAHQWFGNYVTVADWDDLWVKEGMATFLSNVAAANLNDKNAFLSNHGSLNTLKDGEAIIDSNIPPEKKYNSGPYARAAWLLEQLKSIVGEQNFWKISRNTLKKYAMSAVTTDQFLAEFKNDLSPEQLGQVRAALSAKTIPRFSIESASGGIHISVSDAEGSLLTPYLIESYNALGKKIVHAIAPGQPAQLDLTQTELLVENSNLVHPFFLPAAIDKDALFPSLGAKMISSSLLSTVEKLSAENQIYLSNQSKLKIDSGTFIKLTDSAANVDAKVTMIENFCKSAAVQSWDDNQFLAISQAVTGAFVDFVSGRLQSHRSLASCLKFAPDLFKNSFTQAITNPESIGEDEAVNLLELGSLSPVQSFAVWSSLADRGNSFLVRRFAIKHLEVSLSQLSNSPEMTDVLRQQYKDYLINYFHNTDVDVVVLRLIAAYQLFRWENTIPMIPEAVMNSRMQPMARIRSFCESRRISKDGVNSPIWIQMRKDLQANPDIPKDILRFIDDVSLCDKVT